MVFLHPRWLAVSQISEPLNCMEILPILILVGFVALKKMVDDIYGIGGKLPLDDSTIG